MSNQLSNQRLNEKNPAQHCLGTGDSDSRLSVRFEPSADRFSHQWLLDLGDESIVFMSSSEFQNPPEISNPVFQQVVAECHDGTNVILGVGQSGTNHWSATAVERQQPLGIEIEVACRVNKVTGKLATVYQIDGNHQVSQSMDGRVRLKIHGHDLSITPSENVLIKLLHSSRQVMVSPRQTNKPLPATFVWKYSIGFSNATIDDQDNLF